MPAKKTKESRCFVSTLFQRKKGVFQRNMCRDEEIIQLLLAKDIQTINTYLEARTTQVFNSYCYPRSIDVKELYVVSTEEYPPQCLLGEDLLFPSFILGSENQLRETFEWYKERKNPESRCYEDLDLWIEFCLKIALSKINWYSKVINAPRATWVDVFVDSGVQTQTAFIDSHKKLLKELREEETCLKRNNAPEFMLQQQGEKVSRMKLVIQRLFTVIPY